MGTPERDWHEPGPQGECGLVCARTATAIFPAPGFSAKVALMRSLPDFRLGDRPRGRSPWLGARRGFTLIELMVVVLIMGILAAVGLSSFVQHTAHAKNTQALAVCRSIGVAQERYRTLNGVYLDVSGARTLNNPYPVADPGEVEYHFWGQTGHPTFLNWLELAPEVPVYVQYSFAVAAGLPGEAFPALGVAQAPAWPAAVNDPWYVIKAIGDLDGDNENAFIIMTSFGDRIYQESIGE